MEVIREEINPCTLRLTITCDANQVDEGFARAFKQLAKKISLPGFRPGKAPKQILEGLVSPEELKETAADIIVNKIYPLAIEQEGLKPDPTVRPMITVKSLERNPAEAVYIAKVPLPSKITLGAYKGLPVNRPDTSVSEEEVDQQLEAFRKQRQTRESVVDRGLNTGDVAVINIRLVDGDADGRTFMSVAGQLFPQLDEALLGMRVEEMKNLELTFPESFSDKEWAGQTHSVQVTLNSLNAVRLPDLDDEFAKQYYQTESLEQLRDLLRRAISASKEDQSRQLVNEQLLDRLHERSEIFVSDNIWEQLADRRLSETAEEQAKEGRSMEEYAEKLGMTIAELISAWEQKAKLHIERALIIREVFETEKMQLTPNDLQRELVDMAAEYEVSNEKMLEMLQKNDAFDELRFRAISTKVGIILDQNARPINLAAASEELASEAPTDTAPVDTEAAAEEAATPEETATPEEPASSE